MFRVCNTLPSSLFHSHLKRWVVLRQQPYSCSWHWRTHCRRIILQPLWTRYRLPSHVLYLRLIWSHLKLFCSSSHLECNHHSLSSALLSDWPAASDPGADQTIWHITSCRRLQCWACRPVSACPSRRLTFLKCSQMHGRNCTRTCGIPTYTT